MKIDSYVGEESKISIGKKLYDRNVENGDKWNVIVEKETGTTYGTGCIFISKGSDLGNGEKANSNWLIDQNGNLKELADDSFTELDFSSTVGVTNGLVFNMDATNMEEGQEYWGDNITLRYFDDAIYDTIEKTKATYNEQLTKYVSVSQQDAGYDRLISESSGKYIDSENKAFKFNGNNYIEIYNENGFDFSKGLTFEFYGKVSKEVNCIRTGSPSLSLLGVWDGRYDYHPNLRFGIMLDRMSILHCLYTGYREEEECGPFKDTAGNNPFNQVIDFGDKGISLDDEIYISISINPGNDESNASQTIFMNNIFIGNGWLSQTYYDYFVENIKSSKYIELGRCSWTWEGNWCYPKGLCYCTRLYNEGLSVEDIQKNYDKTVAYRELTLKDE